MFWMPSHLGLQTSVLIRAPFCVAALAAAAAVGVPSVSPLLRREETAEEQAAQPAQSTSTTAGAAEAVSAQVGQDRGGNSTAGDLHEVAAKQASNHSDHVDQLSEAMQRKMLVKQAVEELEQTIGNHSDSFSDGHVDSIGLLQRQSDRYDTWANDSRVKRICESGFGAGHSALRFLAQTKSASMISFDIGLHPASKVAASYLANKFGKRLRIIWGDSRYSIPSFYNHHRDTACDVIIVDGGNDQDVAYDDLGNFAALAAPGHILTIDGTPCSAGHCVGPGQAWKSLIDDGCIEEKEAIEMGPDRGFSIGEYRECPYWPNLYLGARLSVGQALPEHL